MTSALLAILTIVAGGLIRLFSTTTGRNPGMTRLISYGVMAAGVALLAMNSVILIDVGEVGVEHFLGRVNQRAHAQGVHVVNPLANIEKMSVREQSFPQGGTVERIEAQTSEQLNVTLEVSVLYQIEASRTPTLFQELGTERQITAAIVLNSVRNGVRDAVATRSINEIFSPDRAELSDNIEAAIQASAEDLYAAMDWLLQRQQRIQGKLARRHFAQGGVVLLDLSSSYFEGAACPLARYGHNRDGKKGKLQVNFGLLCDRHGRPVAINVVESHINPWDRHA